jgi:hypothetical protein
MEEWRKVVSRLPKKDSAKVAKLIDLMKKEPTRKSNILDSTIGNLEL